MNVSVLVKTPKNQNQIKGFEVINADTTKDINKEIENSKSEYILSVNDIDSIKTDFIERGIEVLKSNPEIGIVYENEENSDKNGIPYTMLFRREDFLNAGKYKTHLSDGCEDFDFWITIAEQGFESFKI